MMKTEPNQSPVKGGPRGGPNPGSRPPREGGQPGPGGENKRGPPPDRDHRRGGNRGDDGGRRENHGKPPGPREGGPGSGSRGPRDRDGPGSGPRGPGGRGGGNREMAYSIKQEQIRYQHYAGPTHELPVKEGEEANKKFTGRCRLFVGNLSHEIDEDEFKKLFEKFGAVSEVYINKQKGFGFIKMDTRSNAESARSSLDLTVLKGHTLRVRFASSGTAIKVKNLSPMVSNELLEYAFSMFGDIDRAITMVDERGRPTGEGIIEFSRKNKAILALKRCLEECFLITASPRPVVVEPYEQKDEEEGLPDKMLPTHSQLFMKERDVGPRFAMPNSFEYEFGLRWKQLYELERQKRDALEREIREDRERLEEQMEFAIYEQETNILREKLRQREEDANALLQEREMRMKEQERYREEMRRRQEDLMRQSLGGYGGGQSGGDDMRRRQEDSLLMQASQLNTLLEQQEAAMRHMQGVTPSATTPTTADNPSNGPSKLGPAVNDRKPGSAGITAGSGSGVPIQTCVDRICGG